VAMSNLEEKVNNVMQRTIDVIIRWTGRLLDGQKKGDFKPREDADGGGAWLEALQTPVSLCTRLSLMYYTKYRARLVP